MTQISRNVFDANLRHHPSFVGAILDLEAGLGDEFGRRMANAIPLHLFCGFSQDLSSRVYGVSQSALSRAIVRLYRPARTNARSRHP